MEYKIESKDDVARINEILTQVIQTCAEKTKVLEQEMRNLQDEIDLLKLKCEDMYGISASDIDNYK